MGFVAYTGGARHVPVRRTRRVRGAEALETRGAHQCRVDKRWARWRWGWQWGFEAVVVGPGVLKAFRTRLQLIRLPLALTATRARSEEVARHVRRCACGSARDERFGRDVFHGAGEFAEADARAPALCTLLHPLETRRGRRVRLRVDARNGTRVQQLCNGGSAGGAPATLAALVAGPVDACPLRPPTLRVLPHVTVAGVVDSFTVDAEHHVWVGFGRGFR